MKRYPFSEVEPRWQRFWEERRLFHATEAAGKPKFYCLDMFPYPSGEGLHVGHAEGYTATDILSRYKRMRGFNVLHPMGWDAFGLPAEQYAVRTGVHPAKTTAENIATFRRQMKRVGLSYDWAREINTTDPAYYRWTQWIFLKLFERGLAYVAEVPVNWCPGLGTVLAGEEVIDGKSEVGDFPVVRRPMRQWVLRITAYADGCSRTRTWSTGRTAHSRCRRTGSAARSGPRWISRSPASRARSGSSPLARTRCSAPPTWCSHPSTRWWRW